LSSLDGHGSLHHRNEKVAALASPRKRAVEQGFLEFFEDDGQTGNYSSNDENGDPSVVGKPMWRFLI
jgi:hypothetical protein